MMSPAQLDEDAVMDAGEDALLDRVRQVEASSASIGRGRRTGAWRSEVFDALRAAGLWSVFKPVALGGWECHPVTGLKTFEELPRIEPSVGWAIANQSCIDTFGGAAPSPSTPLPR
jgi:alkylation response protein AidB-like acyl-CoA dehydrogenase